MGERKIVKKKKCLDSKEMVNYLLSRCVENPSTGCLEWIGAKVMGYASFRWKMKGYYGHRFLWEYFNRPLVGDECVCHRCDNRSCLNVNHYFVGTREDNNRDMRNKDRHAYGEKVPTHKLTLDQVVDILQSTDSYKVLADRYGVCANYVWQIKNGRRWKNALSKRCEVSRSRPEGMASNTDSFG